MIRRRLIDTIATAARRGLLVPAFALWALLTVASVPAGFAAPQGKPNIASEVEDATEKKKSGESNGDKSKGAPPPRPTRRQINASRAAGAPQRRLHASARQPAVFAVTFVTDVQQAEIFKHLDGARLESLGKTGAEGRLMARLTQGVYIITASRAGYRVERQQIDVRPGSTTFTFNLIGAPAPVSAEDVIKRFLDPRQTDAVTSGDWQLVQARTGVSFAQDPDNPQIKAQSLFAQGQLAYLRGDYAGALIAFNNSVVAMPDSALAYYGLGNAYAATNQLAEAVRAYQRALDINGGMAMAYKGLGDVSARQGKAKESLKYYERAKAFGYSSRSTTLSAARALMKQQRWSQALKELLEAARAQPTADVFVDIGDCYAALGQPLSAAPAYRRATELDPKSALAHFKYGEAMFQSHEYAAAMEAFERALVLDQTGTVINRARAREMSNKSTDRLRRMNNK